MPARCRNNATTGPATPQPIISAFILDLFIKIPFRSSRSFKMFAECSSHFQDCVPHSQDLRGHFSSHISMPIGSPRISHFPKFVCATNWWICFFEYAFLSKMCLNVHFVRSRLIQLKPMESTVAL